MNGHLVIDGLILDACKPFEVYDVFPRNDSFKSTTSTHIVGKEDNE
jgi:hypothetical protein